MTKEAKQGAVDATHLVVSCIDHRCTDDLTSIMGQIIGSDDAWDRYDHIALPGASLGVVQQAYGSWSQAFWEQLGIALKLHPKITTVVLVDHLHCGAYKSLYPAYKESSRDDHERVTAAFREQLDARKAEWLKCRPCEFEKLHVQRLVLEPCDETKLNWCAYDFDTKQTYLCRKH